jgi:glutamine synthetase
MKDRLRILFCDHLSLARGKYLPGSKIGDGSSRFAQTLFGVHYDRDLLDAPGALLRHGMPDLEARWTAEAIRDGWEPATKVVVAELFDAGGTPLALEGRGALKRAVAGWQARGLTPMVGIELEAFAFQGDDSGRLVPYAAPGGIVYGTGNFTDPLRVTDAIWEKAEAMGFRLEMMTAEYDTPQFEFTLAFDEALAALDDIFLFRQMAREVALDHGIVLSFMPKPIAEAGGSGMHINFSFRDAGGTNALGVEAPPNALARGCIAGLMRHHKALAGLIAPTATSYQRLQPAAMAGYWQNWGGDHRGVTTRVSAETGAKARIEHRMADASANPYTAVAAVLQAARLGVEEGYDLPPMETGDCVDRTDAKVSVAADLRRAVRDLEADRVLCEAVGAELCANHAFMKEREYRKTRDLEGDDLRDFYLHFL